ncbi:hypothetical protein [Sinorhizobium meliloti]|uniref:hypothetical protein n=1 Tax=Rhizobium meliloti TaxID=382 RepID=UPI003BA1AC7B
MASWYRIVGKTIGANLNGGDVFVIDEGGDGEQPAACPLHLARRRREAKIVLVGDHGQL